MNRKQLFKGALLLAVAGGLSVPVCGAEDNTMLEVHLKNSEVPAQEALSGLSKITFEEDGFTVVGKDESKKLVYQYTNVEKLTFSLDGAGVENVTASNLSLVAYPNPAQDVINVQGWNKGEKAMLRIVNAAGQLCKTVADWNGDAIVVSDLAAGQYFIQINNQQTLKFVKL